ncbi:MULTISPECIES: hypothetical protein [Polaromonas]|uniref:Uncharacterized protein n=1 Tax=Polaromonas aquatica TaxID=332657 RepID=A0ABW1U4S9_9BURK
MSKKTKSNLKTCGARTAKKMTTAERELCNNKSGAYRWLNWFFLLIKVEDLFESLLERLPL